MREKSWAGIAAMLVVAACGHKSHGDAPGPASSAAPAKAEPTAVVGAAAPRTGDRPPKPTPTPSAAPPSLPKLGAQVAHATAPAHHGMKDDFPCGSVWSGDEEIPLQCQTPAKDPQLGPPAVPLIPYELLRAAKGDLPSTVDHRLDGFEGRTLQQGKANTCTAFSLASQMDHAIGLWTGKPGDVSPMEIWARYHVGKNGTKANLGLTVANDSDWPYDAARANAWNQCKPGDACLTPEEQRKLDELDKHGVATLEEVERLPEDDRLFDVMEAKLAAGRDIGTGGKLPRGFKPVGDPGAKYIPEFDEVGKGSHAFTIVGYTHVDPTERYFLIKNSWGEKWGDGGYAWIHEHSLRKIAHSGTVAIVDLVADTGVHKRKRSQPVATCADGQAPDSVDAACKPLCADGSPRHDGFCGVTDDCAHGFVNVEGYCVLAAPTAKGTEPTTGITFSCAPGGCVYNVPKAVAPCAGAVCQKSCPAPDFRLGSGKRGLLCLE